MRGFTLIVAATMLVAGALADRAQAGDAAELNILGFSSGGGVFAFEQFGVQDGSGFPYAERFYVDVLADRWLPGTPIRVRLDDETASVDNARQQARAQGQSVIQDAELAANRGWTAGMNPVTEQSADPHRIAVNPRPVFPPIDEPLEFRIEEFPVATPERCAGLDVTIMGLRLLRIGTRDGAPTTLIHEDSTVPASRGCPLGYGIGAVQTIYPASGEPVYAVLVAVRSFGFEGPDHRWIAIPGRIEPR